jgi:hypothetical protein
MPSQIEDNIIAVARMSENVGLESAAAILLREAENESDPHFKQRLLDLCYRIRAMRVERSGDPCTTNVQE